MFTGIIEEIGYINSVVRGTKSIKLTINCKIILSDIKIGDSVSVNGVCLTVTEIGKELFTADVMPETLNKTNLGKLTKMQAVNLERAIKLSDRLGGHIVSGHIDGIGKIIKRVQDDNSIIFEFNAPQHILKYVVEKGSITIDGISLTVFKVTNESFSVSIIPHTANVSIIGSKSVGDIVNIESDILAKYLERLTEVKEVANNKSDISINLLRENGFV